MPSLISRVLDLPINGGAMAKGEILDSRITLTRDLVDQLSIKGMPKVFVSGSAIGFYGAHEHASLRNLIMPVKVFQLICAPTGRQRHEEQSPSHEIVY